MKRFHYNNFVHSPRRALSFAITLIACQTVVAQPNTVEIGLGYNSEDSNRFGQYSGLTQRGGFAIGGFSLVSPLLEANNKSWQLSGKNLGLESSSLSADYRRWGSFSLNLDYDQIPQYRFNDGQTPFVDSGTSLQTLPSNWVGSGTTRGFTALPSALQQVNIDTLRERVTGGFSWQLSEAWKLLSEYRHEIKEGNKTLGAIFGSSGGNARGSLLARPIDFQTDTFDLGLSYSNRSTQYHLGYNLMLFSNQDSALQFSNPFNNSQWVSGANFSDGAAGQIALEPDNTSSQFSFSAAHSFTGSTRLSGSLVTTRLQQDDSYLPYSIAIPHTMGLPASNLHGKVDSLVANLNFSTRLAQKTTLVLRYNYRDRDNKTPQQTYLRIPGDAANQGTLVSENARVNRIYDLERDKFSADLGYRLSNKSRLSTGYEYQETHRTMVDVASSKEHIGFIKLNFTPSEMSSGWIKLTRSDRDASTYNSTVPLVSGHSPEYIATLVGQELFENDPLLRRFHLSDRRRDEFSANLNFYPAESIGISLLGMVVEDDYLDAEVGLTGSDKTNFSADLSYTPEASWRASVYYNFDNYDNRQMGFERRGGANPTPFFPAAVRDPGGYWAINSEDNVNTVGTGVVWELMGGKLDVSVDATYTDAETETRPASTGLPWQRFPDTTTEISSVIFKSHYQFAPGRELSLRYWYEDYDSTDWALDEVTVNTLSNILLPGNESPLYRGNVVELALLFRF